MSRADTEITVYTAVDALPAAVREALEKSEDTSYLHTLSWFEALLETGMSRKPEQRIYVVRYRDTETAVILFALVGEKSKRLTSLTNHYSISFAPAYLGKKAEAMPLLRKLCAYLYAETPAWAQIDLRCLRADRPSTRALRDALLLAGYRVDTFYQYANWYTRIKPFRYNDYLLARSSRLRNTLARKQKSARKKHKITVSIHCEPGAELDLAIEAFQAVYARSWKGAEPSPQFMPRLIRDCAALGVARLGTLSFDGEVAAVQFWMVQGDVALIYKLAHAPEFGELSPGSLLTAEMFQHAIDIDGVSEIDFGIGDEAYKRDWVDQQRQIVGIEALNTRSMAGLGAWVRRCLRDFLRRLGLRSYRRVHLS